MQKRFILFMFYLILSTLVINCNRNQEVSNTTIDQLKSLPYVAWTEELADESVSGVTRYAEEKAYKGYNLFFNIEYKAYLLDMYGNIVHTWYLPYKGEWEYGIIKKNGNLVAVCSQIGIVEIDWYSNLVWATKENLHHDVVMLKDGSYLVPSSFKQEYKSRTVWFNGIQHISKQGELLDNWSTWENLEKIKQYHPPSALDKEPGKNENLNLYFDYYHLNTIQLLPFTWAGVFDKRFKEGNWLMCLRQVDLILIIDKDTKEIVWHYGPGELDWPHMPVMLENGDILIFDNGTKRKYSRIVQINPQSKKIVWEYKTDPREKFFSEFRGSVQRFPNGNTLITNSESGHVFEITKNKENVWEFFNFEIMEKRRKRIYRMIRYPEKMIDSLLKQYPKKEEEKITVRIANKNFEEGDNGPGKKPLHWDYVTYSSTGNEFIWDNSESKFGEKCVKIILTENDDASWFQTIDVKPFTTYKVSGWIKTMDIPPGSEHTFPGAKFAITTDPRQWPAITEPLIHTNDWTFVSCEFYSGNNKTARIQCRLGFFGASTTGTAWFDNMDIEELGR